MTPASDAPTELVQRLTILTARVSQVSQILAEAGRDLMERRALPPDTLVDEMAAVHTDFAELRDRVVAAAATLAAGTPPPITTLRELEVLVNALVEGEGRRARRSSGPEEPGAAAASPVTEARAKVEERRGNMVVEDTRRKVHDEARRKAAEAEEAWRRAEAEAKRRAGEEAQRRAAEDARRRAEDEARRKAAEAEDARRRAEDELRRNSVVAEAGRRKAAEAEARKAREEAERQAAEHARQRAAAAEAKGKADEEDARRRAAEEAQQKAVAIEAKRKADQEAQREAQERAAEDARRRTAEAAQPDADEVVAEIADPAAATEEEEAADSGLETAQWWISASANWAAMRSKKVSFAAAVSDVLTKYPHFLSVPIQTSADYEDGMLAYGYGILLEHIEQGVPSFVADAFARLPARPGMSLGRRLYDYLAQALGVGYGDFIKAVMLAAMPKTLPWATGGIEDGETTTTVFVRPSARVGDTHQKAERFTQAHQRFGEHHFTAAVAPITTRFFRVDALDVKEARHLGLRISEKGVPSDQAWVVSVGGRGGAPQARRHVPQGTVINGLGREFTSVWVGLFNADAENEKRYDVTVEVSRRQPGTAGFRKR